MGGIIGSGSWGTGRMVVLSTHEVISLLKAPERLQEKVMFALTYDTGIRIDELTNLLIGNIDLDRGRVRKFGCMESLYKKKTMSSHPFHELAIIMVSLNVAPVCATTTTTTTWQEVAFERMGIKPGVCNYCGGKMVIIETIPNQFAPGNGALH